MSESERAKSKAPQLAVFFALSGGLSACVAWLALHAVESSWGLVLGLGFGFVAALLFGAAKRACVGKEH